MAELVLERAKVVREMPVRQQRMLGFLVAHPGWHAARSDADRETALALKTRGYLDIVHATEPDPRHPSRLVHAVCLHATADGEEFALGARLECPGRATGECGLCAALSESEAAE